jgi:hypothetical protein
LIMSRKSHIGPLEADGKPRSWRTRTRTGRQRNSRAIALYGPVGSRQLRNWSQHLYPRRRRREQADIARPPLNATRSFIAALSRLVPSAVRKRQDRLFPRHAGLPARPLG